MRLLKFRALPGPGADGWPPQTGKAPARTRSSRGQKKCPRRLQTPATGKQIYPWRISQAGPCFSIGDRAETDIENKRENSVFLPAGRPGGAIRSRFRVGRHLFHQCAFVLDLTSKGIRKFCQEKTAQFPNFLRIKHHIARSHAAATAIRRINFPISEADIIARRVSEPTGGAIDGCRVPFEFKKGARRCFVKVQMNAR